MLITAIGGLAGLVAALAAGAKTLGELRTQSKSHGEALQAIQHETSPNSGQSMNDKVSLKLVPQVEKLTEIAADLAAQMEQAKQAAAERRVESDRRLEGVEKGLRGVQRDVGRAADGIMKLADVDREDRERAQREHAEINTRVGHVEGALEAHLSEGCS